MVFLFRARLSLSSVSLSSSSWLLLLLLLLLRQCPLPVAAGCSLLVAMRAFIVAGCFLFVADYRVLVLSQLVSGFVTCFCTCARILNLVIVSRRCQRRHRLHRECCCRCSYCGWLFAACSSLLRFVVLLPLSVAFCIVRSSRRVISKV